MPVYPDDNHVMLRRDASCSVYLGRKTAQSLPAARVRANTKRDGHIFTSGGDQHWSTFACMQEVHHLKIKQMPSAILMDCYFMAEQYIKKIIIPDLEGAAQRKGLKYMEALLIIDCWSVHNVGEKNSVFG